ncbi:hypothetical protein [Rhizobium sp.]|uniref:hypothetical protein n=1 Tax=Rhizobium sp. TaxID=391 RepID=UPI0028B0C507
MMVEGAGDSDAKLEEQASGDPLSGGQSDYCGIPLDEWKVALQKDVAERFGPVPTDLPPMSKSGW